MFDKNTINSVWEASPAGSFFMKHGEPGTKEFFETTLEKRMNYECDWLNEIVDFKRFDGKKVLEIGCGAGYDAYAFCKNGADYTGIDITPNNIIIARKHLSYYGYIPKVIEMDAEELNLDKKFDYVYSFGVLHHTPNIYQAFSKVCDVLNKNGEFQVIVYHKNSIFYCLSLFFFDWILRLGFLKESFKNRLSRIEYTTSNELPLVNVYSKKDLYEIFERTGFEIVDTQIRKCVKEDLPGIPLIKRLYKFIPKKVLGNIGKRFGWYISVRGIKK